RLVVRRVEAVGVDGRWSTPWQDTPGLRWQARGGDQILESPEDFGGRPGDFRRSVKKAPPIFRHYLLTGPLRPAEGWRPMAGGHDQLWKDLIRTFPADFLRLAAGDLAGCLEVASLVLEPAETFLDQPRGAERRMDLVGTATTRVGEELLLHVEIELRYRRTIPPRLWLYNRLLGLRRGLPVHTIVLYLHGGPAEAAVAIHREVSAGRELCRFSYLSFGLSRAPAEPYLARPEPLAWAFAARMRPEGGERRRLRRAFFERIAGARHLNDYERFLLF